MERIGLQVTRGASMRAPHTRRATASARPRASVGTPFNSTCTCMRRAPRDDGTSPVVNSMKARYSTGGTGVAWPGTPVPRSPQRPRRGGLGHWWTGAGRPTAGRPGRPGPAPGRLPGRSAGRSSHRCSGGTAAAGTVQRPPCGGPGRGARTAWGPGWDLSRVVTRPAAGEPRPAAREPSARKVRPGKAPRYLPHRLRTWRDSYLGVVISRPPISSGVVPLVGTCRNMTGHTVGAFPSRRSRVRTRRPLRQSGTENSTKTQSVTGISQFTLYGPLGTGVPRRDPLRQGLSWVRRVEAGSGIVLVGQPGPARDMASAEGACEVVQRQRSQLLPNRPRKR
jgi:hypothetical protein